MKTELSRAWQERGTLTNPRILLADDSREMLEHVRTLLREQHEVVAAVSDPKSIVREVESHRPDLIVLDISMGDVSGIDVARALVARGFCGKIVFLSVHEDPDFISAAMAAGGSGYVFKDRVSPDLELAIEEVMAGRVFLSSAGPREA